jgi:hypothetical protein
MGWLEDAANSFVSAVETVVDVAEDVVEVVEEVAEAVGAVVDAVIDAALSTESAPPSGNPPRKDPIPDNPFFDLLRENADAFVSAVITPYRDAAKAVVLGISGAIKTATGDTEGGARDLEAAENIGLGMIGNVVLIPASAAIMVGANYIAAAQKVFGVEGKARPLTAAERAILIPIFESSINYDIVSIEEGNVGLFALTDSGAFVVGHRIRIVSPNALPVIDHPGVLVHETVHVWQFENGGPGYIGQALGAQALGGVGSVSPTPGYDFDNAVAAGLSWGDLFQSRTAGRIHRGRV